MPPGAPPPLPPPPSGALGQSPVGPTQPPRPPLFNNPVYRLERGTGPFWRYAARATFPAWLLVPLVPLTVGFVVGYRMSGTSSAGGMGTGLNFIAATAVCWALMLVYPLWAGMAIVTRWRQTGQMEAIRLTLLDAEDVARGLALAAGVRCAFVAGSLFAGFIAMGGLLVMMTWARTGDLELELFVGIFTISLMQAALFIPLVLIPNVLVGVWAGLRWRHAPGARLMIVAAALPLESLIVMNCSCLYVGVKGFIWWWAWRETVTLLRRLKDS